jgi:hypothetical protein
VHIGNGAKRCDHAPVLVEQLGAHVLKGIPHRGLGQGIQQPLNTQLPVRHFPQPNRRLQQVFREGDRGLAQHAEHVPLEGLSILQHLCRERAHGL